MQAVCAKIIKPHPGAVFLLRFFYADKDTTGRAEKILVRRE